MKLTLESVAGGCVVLEVDRGDPALWLRIGDNEKEAAQSRPRRIEIAEARQLAELLLQQANQAEQLVPAFEAACAAARAKWKGTGKP